MAESNTQFTETNQSKERESRERIELLSGLHSLSAAYFDARKKQDRAESDTLKQALDNFHQAKTMPEKQGILNGVKSTTALHENSKTDAQLVEGFQDHADAIYRNDYKAFDRDGNFANSVQNAEKLVGIINDSKSSVENKRKALLELIDQHERDRQGLVQEFFLAYNELVKRYSEEEVRGALEGFEIKGSGGKAMPIRLEVDGSKIKSIGNRIWRIHEAMNRLVHVLSVDKAYDAMDSLGFSNDKEIKDISEEDVKKLRKQYVKLYHPDMLKNFLKYTELDDNKKKEVDAVMIKMGLGGEEIKAVENGELSSGLEAKMIKGLHNLSSQVNLALERLLKDEVSLDELKELEKTPHVKKFFNSDEEGDQAQATATAPSPATSAPKPAPVVTTSPVQPSAEPVQPAAAPLSASPQAPPVSPPVQPSIPEAQKTREQLIQGKANDIKGWLAENKTITLPSAYTKDERVKQFPNKQDLVSKVTAYLLEQSGKKKQLQFVDKSASLGLNQVSFKSEVGELSEVELLKALNQAIESDLKTDAKKLAANGLIEFVEKKNNNELGDSKNYPTFAGVWQNIHHSKIGNSFEVSGFNPTETNLDGETNLSNLNKNGIVWSNSLSRLSDQKKGKYQSLLGSYLDKSLLNPAELVEVEGILKNNSEDLKDVFIETLGARGNRIRVVTRDLREPWHKDGSKQESSQLAQAEVRAQAPIVKTETGFEHITFENMHEHIGKPNLASLGRTISSLKERIKKNVKLTDDDGFNEYAINRELERVVRVRLKNMRPDQIENAKFMRHLAEVIVKGNE